MDPGGCADGVVDVVGAALGGEASFPVGGEVGLWLGKGGHGLSGEGGEGEGVGRWRSKGKGGRRMPRRVRRLWFILRLSHIRLVGFLLAPLLSLRAQPRLSLVRIYHIDNRGSPDPIRGHRHHQPPVHRVRFARPVLQIIRNHLCKFIKSLNPRLSHRHPPRPPTARSSVSTTEIVSVPKGLSVSRRPGRRWSNTSTLTIDDVRSVLDNPSVKQPGPRLTKRRTHQTIRSKTDSATS